MITGLRLGGKLIEVDGLLLALHLNPVAFYKDQARPQGIQREVELVGGALLLGRGLALPIHL